MTAAVFTRLFCTTAGDIWKDGHTRFRFDEHRENGITRPTRSRVAAETTGVLRVIDSCRGDDRMEELPKWNYALWPRYRGFYTRYPVTDLAQHRLERSRVFQRKPTRPYKC